MSTQATTFDLHQVFDQARKGDDGAFGRLVERYKNLVFSVALGILGDVEAARDVTQGVFLTAWQRLRELRSASSIPPWLRETARRQALYHLRGKVRERARSEQALPLVEASPGTRMPNSSNSRTRVLSEVALDQLPAEAREVLLLYYSEEQSIAQVASLLDLSESAVKKRLQRGRTLLREGHAQVLSSKTARVAPGAALVAAILGLAAWRGAGSASATSECETTGMTAAAAVVLIALLVVGAVLARNHRAAGPAGAAATASAPTPTGPVSSSAGAPPTPSGSSHPRGPANAAASKPAASITAEAAPSDCDDPGGLVLRRAWAIAHGEKPAQRPSPPSEIERRLEQAYVEWFKPVAAHQRGEPVDEAAYRQMSASWREAVTWLIPRCSASREMTTPEMQPRLGEGDVRSSERLWLAEAATHPKNARVQYNTAVFVQRSSPDRARPFFERAAQLEPENGEWSFALAGLERNRGQGGSAEERQDAHQNSIGYYEHALSKARSPTARAQILGQLSKAAIEVGEDGIADQRAREELELVPSLHGFMVPNTLHEGHILLGELALRRNDDALAARELMTAAEVDGSATLNSFGPNTELAQQLLARGQRDVVIRYLERVGRFWKDDCLAPWLVAVRAGETPDFAAGRWDCNTRVAR